jgi:hypothetical protein
MKLFPIQCGFHPEPSTETLSTLASWRNFLGIKLFIFAEFTIQPGKFSVGRHFYAACKPRNPATHLIGLGLSTVVESGKNEDRSNHLAVLPPRLVSA